MDKLCYDKKIFSNAQLNGRNSPDKFPNTVVKIGFQTWLALHWQEMRPKGGTKIFLKRIWKFLQNLILNFQKNILNG